MKFTNILKTLPKGLYIVFLLFLFILFVSCVSTGDGDVERPAVRLSDPKIITNQPSQVQFVFGLKDDNNKTYPIEISGLEDNVKIYEDNKEIQYEETSVFVRSAESFELEVVLVLDYTNSMFEIAGAIDQMQQAAKDLINQLSASHRIAIIEYHDRNEEPKVLQDFTSDKQTLINTIENIGELDHGSSRCWDAVELGTSLFSTRTSSDDVRALVFLTDGEDTSSTATPEDIIETARGKGIVIYPIAFGEIEEEAKLILEKIAIKTEGIYYEASDSEGLKEQFAGIVADLGGKYKVSYISLKREGIIQVKFEVYIEEKDLTLTYKNDVDMSNIYGPDNVGRITQDTSKVTEGRADVFLRSEHTPRNVKRIRFKLDTTLQYEIVLPPKEQGGLLEGWTLSEQDAEGYYVVSTGGDAVKFADFGLLLNVKLDGLESESSFVRIPFEIDNSIYAGRKRFSYDSYLIAGRNIKNMVPLEGGSFIMGSSNGHTDELPKHETFLSDFYIDQTEVTNSEFAEFLNNIKSIQNSDGQLYIKLNPEYSAIVYDQVIDVYRVKEGWENFPALGVTWYGAKAYAQWNGKRLPTEAEWEYAASNGGKTRWSLGNEFISNDYVYWENKGGRYDSTRIGTAPVTKIWNKESNSWVEAKKNDFGLYHMSGNVWEWVNDWYGAYPEFTAYDPRGVAFGSGKVLRGGAWMLIKDLLRTRFRGNKEAYFGSEETGFRCASDAN